MYDEIEERLNFENRELLGVKKRLNNDLQLYKGNIRVYLRIRPFIDTDLQEDKDKSFMNVLTNTKLKVNVPEEVFFWFYSKIVHKK